MTPKIAKFFDNWGGGGAQRARIRVADACPSNFPPSAGPGEETTRRYGRKTFAAKILAETFFVHISLWSSRLDLPTGENSRGRRWLLESARVAPRSPEFTTHPRRFGGPRFRKFHAQNCFKTRRFFSKIMTPKIAKFFDNWGGGVRNARGFE